MKNSIKKIFGYAARCERWVGFYFQSKLVSKNFFAQHFDVELGREGGETRKRIDEAGGVVQWVQTTPDGRLAGFGVMFSGFHVVILVYVVYVFVFFVFCFLFPRRRRPNWLDQMRLGEGGWAARRKELAILQLPRAPGKRGKLAS